MIRSEKKMSFRIICVAMKYAKNVGKTTNLNGLICKENLNWIFTVVKDVCVAHPLQLTKLFQYIINPLLLTFFIIALYYFYDSDTMYNSKSFTENL